MLTCMVVFVTVGLVVVNFQAKTVTIDYYGEKIQVNTMSNTVEGMLMQNEIYIDEKAIVYPNVETILKDNMEIKIYSEDEVARLDGNDNNPVSHTDSYQHLKTFLLQTS